MSRVRERSGLPAFTGITTYRDPQGRFEFRHPSDWDRYELDEDRDGVLIRPEVEDEHTYFAIWISPLSIGVVADDLPELRRGFDDGLGRLADARIDKAADDTYGNIVKLERWLTFTEAGVVRKRRTWGLYVDTWQLVATYQGSTVGEYDYWEPMGNYCFATFQLPNELWFATDPEIDKSAYQ